MDNSDNSRRTLSEALRTGSLGEDARRFLAGPAVPPPPRKSPGRFPNYRRDPWSRPRT
jgi:hypothetical protein